MIQRVMRMAEKVMGFERAACQFVIQPDLTSVHIKLKNCQHFISVQLQGEFHVLAAPGMRKSHNDYN